MYAHRDGALIQCDAAAIRCAGSASAVDMGLRAASKQGFQPLWRNACRVALMATRDDTRKPSGSVLRRQWGLLLSLVFLAPAATVALDFDHQVPLVTSPGGSFYVTSSVAGIEAEFLVDTGAGYVTLGSELFSALRSQGAVREVRRVAARLANGRLKPVTVYEVEHFVIGDGCDIGPVEVAVLPGAGRNLLGLSALTRAAPFAIHTSPPALALSGCDVGPVVAARD